MRGSRGTKEHLTVYFQNIRYIDLAERLRHVTFNGGLPITIPQREERAHYAQAVELFKVSTKSKRI